MSTTPRKDLPSTNAPNWSQRVTEELRVLMGRGGNGRALTAKDLIDSGIAKPGAGGGIVPGNPGSGDSEPDLTPPPTPTGFEANAAITNIIIQHDAPVFRQGHGHAATVVYGVMHVTGDPLPTFDKAVELMRFVGSVASYPTTPATTWRLWIKWLSLDGVQSVDPAGGINGLTVRTGEDVGKLLEVLEGKITTSQLYEELSKEIGLISGSGSGSVNARVLAEAQVRAQAVAAEAAARAQDILAEAQARAQAMAGEASARTQGLQAEQQARADAVQAEAAARAQALAQVAADLQAASQALQGNIDAVNAQVADIIGAAEYDPATPTAQGQLVKYSGKLYRAKVNVPAGNPPPAAAYWSLVGDYASIGEAVAAHAAQLADHDVRIGQTEQGLTAEATARNSLAVQLRGNYTGTDITKITSGLVYSEQQARVSGDSVNASAIQAVSVRLPTGTGKVAAAADVAAEQQARIDGDSANASALQTVTARMPTGTGKVATEASVTAEAMARTSEDSALGQRASNIEARLPSGTGQLATSAQVTAEEQARVAADQANASLIQGVQASLGDAGGQNLLYNPSFEIPASGGSDGWSVSGSSGVGRTASRVESSLDGGIAQRLDVTGLAGSLYASMELFTMRRPRVTPDTAVAASAYFRGAAGLQGFIVCTWMKDGVAVGSQRVSAYVDASDAWQRISFVPPINAGANTFYFSLRVRTAGAITSGWVEWDRAQIEAGGVVTGWRDNSDAQRIAISAAVTDEAAARVSGDSALASRATALESRMPAGTGQLATAAAVTALDTRVTTTEGAITSQGQSITALQNSIANGPVLPNDFSAGLSNWTGSRQGDPTTVNTVAGTVVTDDADFGACAQFNNWTVAGISVLTKGVVPATPGRVYRVRARCKVVAAPSFPVALGIVAGGNKGDYTISGDSFGAAVSVPAAGQVVEVTALFSNAAANAAGAVAWNAASVYLRFGLRLNVGLGAGLQLRVQSIVVEDITGESANAGAISSLTNRVTSAEGALTSQSGSITSLQSSVSNLQTGKADASALSALDTKVTQQGNTITSQGGAITELSNGLSAAQLQAVNVIADPGLERDGLNWGSIGAPWAIVAEGRNGGKCLHSGVRPTQAARTANTNTIGNRVTVEVGQTWRIRLWYKTSADFNGTLSNSKARLGNQTGALVVSAPYATPSTEWTQVSVTYKVAAGVTAIGLSLMADNTAGYVLVDDVELTNITDAVAAQSSADAASSAVQALTTRVTAAEGSITSQAGQLASMQSSLSGKADAGALSALDTKVTSIDGRLTSTASRVDSLQSSVASAATGLQALNGLGGESEWIAADGAASATFVTVAEQDARGGAVLTVGNATLNGLKWLRHAATIPFDETKLYKLTARFRRTAGTGSVYLGIAARNAANTLYVNTSNVENSAISSAHYAVTGATPALGVWQTVEFYFKGRSAGAATGSGTKASPRTLANKTALLSLMFLGNYNGQVGLCDLDYIALEDATAVDAASSAVQALDIRVTAAEGSITSQASQITNLQASLGGAGGENLLYNPSFEVVVSGGPEGWSVSGSSGVGRTGSMVPSSLDGGNARRLDVTGLATTGSYASLEMATDKRPRVSGDVAMAASAYFRGAAGLQGFIVCTWLKNGAVVGSQRISAYVDASDAWQRISFPVSPVVNGGADTFYLSLRARSPNASLTSGWIEWDRAQIEIGDVVTGWRDNRKAESSAQASAISALDSKVTQQGDTLTSQAGQITSLSSTLTTTTGTANAAQAAAQAASDLAGGKGKVIYSSTAPAVADRQAQNLWIDTTGNANTPKRWTGSAWATVTDKVATDAAAAAAAAQATANTKADASAMNLLDSKVTSIDGRVTAQATGLSRLEAALGTAQQQAVNVIVNPGFANGSEGWTLAAGWAVVAEGSDGGNCLKLSGATGGTSRPSALSVTVRAGQTWRARMRGKRTADFNGTNGNSKLRFTHQGNLLNALTLLYNDLPSSDWGVQERTWTATADGELSCTLVRDSTVGTVWFDDFELTNITDMTSVSAAVQSAELASATRDAALGQRIDTVQATAAGNSAAIQSETTTRAAADGHLGAQYSVRMQLSQGGQQVVGGFGFSGTSSGTAGPQIDFGVMANSFWIAAPSGSPAGVANVKPFVVQTTSQTVNGVVVPAGVYMDAAYINNVTVLFGRFGTLLADKIQATAISASQLTLGDGTIGGNLKSSNFVAGTSGWRLMPNGTAEFSGVTVRGTVYATAGTVGGFNIGSNYFRSTNYAAGSRGINMTPAGDLEARNSDNTRVFHLGAGAGQPILKVPGFEVQAGSSPRMTAGRIQNAANTTFIDLNATGGVRAIQFGDDLTYSEDAGLVINRLSVIKTSNLAPNSVSEQQYIAMQGEIELFHNNNFTQYWTVSLPPGRTALIVNSGSYQLNTWNSNLGGYKIEILVRAWGAGTDYRDLGTIVLNEVQATGSEAPPPSWFSVPLVMVNSDVYPNVVFYYRSIGAALINNMTRKINAMNMDVLTIKR